jgi:hypothetical protein
MGRALRCVLPRCCRHKQVTPLQRAHSFSIAILTNPGELTDTFFTCRLAADPRLFKRSHQRSSQQCTVNQIARPLENRDRVEPRATGLVVPAPLADTQCVARRSKAFDRWFSTAVHDRRRPRQQTPLAKKRDNYCRQRGTLVLLLPCQSNDFLRLRLFSNFNSLQYPHMSDHLATVSGR